MFDSWDLGDFVAVSLFLAGLFLLVVFSFWSRYLEHIETMAQCVGGM